MLSTNVLTVNPLLTPPPPLFRGGKLISPPPPLLSPPSKVLEKNKPPGGLIEDLGYMQQYISKTKQTINSGNRNYYDSLQLGGNRH